MAALFTTLFSLAVLRRLWRTKNTVSTSLLLATLHREKESENTNTLRHQWRITDANSFRHCTVTATHAEFAGSRSPVFSFSAIATTWSPTKMQIQSCSRESLNDRFFQSFPLHSIRREIRLHDKTIAHTLSAIAAIRRLYSARHLDAAGLSRRTVIYYAIFWGLFVSSSSRAHSFSVLSAIADDRFAFKTALRVCFSLSCTSQLSWLESVTHLLVCPWRKPFEWQKLKNHWILNQTAAKWNMQGSRQLPRTPFKEKKKKKSLRSHTAQNWNNNNSAIADRGAHPLYGLDSKADAVYNVLNFHK